MNEEDEGFQVAELLGWLLDGWRRVVAPTSKRLWRLRYALYAAVGRGRMSGKQM